MGVKRARAAVTVGIDIGGTFVKFGLVRGGRILAQRMVATADYSTPARLQDGLVWAAQSLMRGEGRHAAGVGVGIPGLVTFPEGLVRTCVNIRGWKDVPLRALLERRLRLPVRVDNDVNVMTLAEWTSGAGRGARDLVCMTLGTGVGGGLVLNGALYRGWNGSAGEIGHCPVGEAGPACACGGVACLERYVGNREIVKWVRGRLSRGARSAIPRFSGGDLNAITPETIDEACRKGDRLAAEAWRWAGTRIGLVLSGVVNLLDPERIVIGGGVAKAGHWLFDPIRETVRRRSMDHRRKVKILPARLGSSAGLIGAARLVQDSL